MKFKKKIKVKKYAKKFNIKRVPPWWKNIWGLNLPLAKIILFKPLIISSWPEKFSWISFKTWIDKIRFFLKAKIQINNDKKGGINKITNISLRGIKNLPKRVKKAIKKKYPNKYCKWVDIASPKKIDEDMR